MNDKRINVIIPDDLKLSVKLKATAEGKTLTQVVLDLLKKWLNQQGKRK